MRTHFANDLHIDVRHGVGMHQSKNDKRSQALVLMLQLKDAREKLRNQVAKDHHINDDLLALLHDAEDMLEILIQ